MTPPPLILWVHTSHFPQPVTAGIVFITNGSVTYESPLTDLRLTTVSFPTEMFPTKLGLYLSKWILWVKMHRLLIILIIIILIIIVVRHWKAVLQGGGWKGPQELAIKTLLLCRGVWTISPFYFEKSKKSRKEKWTYTYIQLEWQQRYYEQLFHYYCCCHVGECIWYFLSWFILYSINKSGFVGSHIRNNSQGEMIIGIMLLPNYRRAWIYPHILYAVTDSDPRHSHSHRRTCSLFLSWIK